MKPVRVNPARQQGASLWGTMLMVGLIGLALTMALKIAPAYMTNNIIANAINGIIANNDIKTMAITEIRNDLMRTVRTNRIEGFDPGDVTVVRENNLEYIDINYERRVHLMYNIDAVVVFNDRFNKF